MSEEKAAKQAEEHLLKLKKAADNLGVTYNANIGAAKLQEKINEFILTQPLPKAPVTEAAPASATKPLSDHTKAQMRMKIDNQIRKDARKLTRVVIQCMNPNKKDWDGEIFTVSGGIAGTVKRYIPFNNPAGWHVEQMLLDHLKEREYQHFRKKSIGRGQVQVIPELVKEFQITILPPLTKEELEELKTQQALNRSVDR